MSQRIQLYLFSLLLLLLLCVIKLIFYLFAISLLSEFQSKVYCVLSFSPYQITSLRTIIVITFAVIIIDVFGGQFGFSSVSFHVTVYLY